VILAIDPGDKVSSYALIDPHDCRPREVGELPNHELRVELLRGRLRVVSSRIVVEMIESYGMPVGREIFDTVWWTGRFVEVALPVEVEMIGRKAVKRHHCGTTAAKDPNVAQALIDRFAPGERNRGKGTKAQPGWFFGFAGGMWQAYALAVYAADQVGTEEHMRDWAAGKVNHPGEAAL
jgi:hypothetical protein